MADFPALAVLPGYNIEPDGSVEEATVRQVFDGGYEISRPRYTRLRKQWGIRYVLTDADLLTLRDFERETSNGGADAFNWPHPVEADEIALATESGEEIYTEAGERIDDEASVASSYFVRFMSPLNVSYFAPGLWSVSLNLREV